MARTKTSRPESVAATSAKFFFATVGLIGVVGAIGYVPTMRLGGEGSMAGMLAGCGVSLAGSWIGSIPIFVALRAGQGAAIAALASMALRFVLVGGAALAIALSGTVSQEPFLIWVAISYVVLLIADVMLALRCSSQTLTKVNKGENEINDTGIG